MRYVAFLRGINLGAARKIGMADLRSALSAAGLEDVTTHLRSGNVIVRSDRDPQPLREHLEETIRSSFAMEVAVVVRTGEQMTRIVAACPYPEAAREDPTKVHVMFLEPMPPPTVWEGLDAEAFAPDEFEVGEGALYIHLPNGMARAKLPAALERAARGSTATTRNWRTVRKLLEMS